MKVNDIMKKINYGLSKLPVYLQDNTTCEKRKADSFDYAGYYYPEKDRTITSISILTDKVVIYYK